MFIVYDLRQNRHGSPSDRNSLGNTVTDIQLQAQSEGALVGYQIEDIVPNAFQQSLRLLTHLLGHEGFGSICSVLKKKGWITQLSASRSSGDIDNGFDFIRVGMVLTPEGLG